MKIKFLSLFLAFTLFALGTSLNATTPSEHGDQKDVSVLAPGEHDDQKEVSPPSPSDVLSLLCNWVRGLSKAPEACNQLCANVTNPNWAAFTCCVTAAKTWNVLPSSVDAPMTTICTAGCNRWSCGSSGTKAFLANTCGALCCNTGWGSVTNCLAQNSETCSGNFAVDTSTCPICTGSCCPNCSGDSCQSGQCPSSVDKDGKKLSENPFVKK